MSETALQRRIVKAIKARWPDAWVYHPSDRKRMGVPDLLICLNGRFGAIEVKLPGNPPTALQYHTQLRIVEAGGVAGVATSVETAMLTMEALERKHGYE